MSLKATGIPVSGAPSPLPSRSSARRAAESAWSSSTVMKAFSSRWARTRSRHSRVSSAEETLLAASAPESSASVEFSTLFDDPRHEVKAFLDRRRDRLISRALVSLGDFVRARALHEIQGVGQGLDALGVDRAHLLDQA